MKAVHITRYGDAGVLTVSPDVPQPAAGSGQVLVEVHAAGINPVDSALRQGYMQKMAPLQFPATLGIDLSGVIREVGAGVTQLKSGDKVYGQASILAGASGAFAEYASAPAAQICRMPARLSFVEAAGLPLTGVSALQVLYEHMKLKPGQKILIHGGAGGIGTVAIQMAKGIGAYVASTCLGEAVSYVKSLGVDEAIDFESMAFYTLLREYDAVFDTVGGETYKSSFSVLRKDGVIVSMLEQPNADLSAKHGVTAIAQRTEVNTARLDKLSQLVADGTIKVYVDRVFPLEQVKEAFLFRESGKVRGKVVLQMRKEG
jgi:NADPH:quinone reductase-like Zn-dependent oxidoreductase